MGLQGVTRGYNGLQGITRGYNGLQGVTSGYKGFQGVTRGYRGLQGITGANKRLQKGFLARTSLDTLSWFILQKNQCWRNFQFLTKIMD